MAEEEEVPLGLSDDLDESIKEPKLYKQRWLMIAIFSYNTMCNSMGWITYGSVALFAMDLYNIGSLEVNMLSLLYLIMYIPFIVPSAYLLDSKGLRVGTILASFLSSIGCWIRYFGRTPKSFFWIFIGQSFLAYSGTLVLSVPPRLSTNWFGENERITATSIGSVCNQFGIAVGFFLAALIVKKKEDITNLALATAVITTIGFLLTVILFKDKPPTPPSKQADTKKTNFKKSLRELLHNPMFWLLSFAFGLNTGSFITLSSLVDQTIGPKGYNQQQTGALGTVMIVSGVFGAVFISFLAGMKRNREITNFPDKMKRLKLFLLVAYAISAFSTILFIFCVRPNSIVLIAFVYGLMGIFQTAVMPLTMEAIVNVTFPIAEELSTGIAIIATQAAGVVITLVMQSIASKADYVVATWFSVALFIISFILVIPLKLK